MLIFKFQVSAFKPHFGIVWINWSKKGEVVTNGIDLDQRLTAHVSEVENKQHGRKVNIRFNSKMST